MKNNYKLENEIEKLLRGQYTFFLDALELNIVKSKLNKNDYNEYYTYKDASRIILYKKEKPRVSLFKVNCYEKLRHQDIMGSILNLNILPSYLGDIIIDNDNYYFYILSELSNFIKQNLTVIGNKYVTLEEISINYLEDYEIKYEENNTIVSSLRIDNVISKIINVNRKEIINKIKNKEIIINYKVLTKASYILKENDIFSVRKYGKYKYIGIINNTKKNNLIIKYLKYI